jgi:hypothetical protein
MLIMSSGHPSSGSALESLNGTRLKQAFVQFAPHSAKRPGARTSSPQHAAKTLNSAFACTLWAKAALSMLPHACHAQLAQTPVMRGRPAADWKSARLGLFLPREQHPKTSLYTRNANNRRPQHTSAARHHLQPRNRP